eukprot:2881262-Prymnesium_polylepis.2
MLRCKSRELDLLSRGRQSGDGAQPGWSQHESCGGHASSSHDLYGACGAAYAPGRGPPPP